MLKMMKQRGVIPVKQQDEERRRTGKKAKTAAIYTVLRGRAYRKQKQQNNEYKQRT
jgi:hypothetical protein